VNHIGRLPAESGKVSKNIWAFFRLDKIPKRESTGQQKRVVLPVFSSRKITLRKMSKVGSFLSSTRRTSLSPKCRH